MPISSFELKHFLSYAFVECGSASGLGISSALIAGFDKVYSVDINPECFRDCRAAFGSHPCVNLSLGDCGEWLQRVLNEIGRGCTVYLDANGWKYETESPFQASIEALVRHGGSNHIILVDDINHGFRPREEVVRDLRDSDMIKQLRRINPYYHFYTIDTQSENQQHRYPDWVLVADPAPSHSSELPRSQFI